MSSVYALLEECPGSSFVAKAHLTRLTKLLCSASKGHYKKEKAISLKEAAASSIGCVLPAKSLELKHTIQLIRILSEEINEIEIQIKEIMEKINSPITSIPGIGFRMAAMILAEIGDFSNFDSPDKILAFAGLSPSTYQSGKLENAYAHMEKRGSRYLRYALYNAAIYVCKWDPTFSAYLQKKRSDGKHYYVAISHAIKKLVRVIYSLEKTGQTYIVAS
jgi:transposase